MVHRKGNEEALNWKEYGYDRYRLSKTVYQIDSWISASCSLFNLDIKEHKVDEE